MTESPAGRRADAWSGRGDWCLRASAVPTLALAIVLVVTQYVTVPPAAVPYVVQVYVLLLSLMGALWFAAAVCWWRASSLRRGAR